MLAHSPQVPLELDAELPEKSRVAVDVQAGRIAVGGDKASVECGLVQLRLPLRSAIEHGERVPAASEVQQVQQNELLALPVLSNTRLQGMLEYRRACSQHAWQ